METLQDWKAALASGVKIETLLGLDKDKSSSPDGDLLAGASKSAADDNQPDLSVKTSDGQVLKFQWSSLSLSSICPDVNGREAEGESNSSIPSTLVVSPPSIPVKQILGPCFIDLSSGQDAGNKQDHQESNSKISTSPD